MAIIPLELIAIITVALLLRTTNKFIPLYERFLAGLRFFEVVIPDQIAQYLKTVAANLSDVSLVGSGLSTAADTALAVVNTRARSITYSYFPICPFPWDSMLYKESLNLVTSTGTYGVVAYLLASVVETVTTGAYSGNVDIMLVAVFGALLFTPVQHFTLLGPLHAETLVSGVMGFLAFIGCLFVTHAPEQLHLTPFSISRALADVTITLDEGARFTGNSEVSQPEHPDYLAASGVLSAVVGVVVALTFPAIQRVARAYLLVSRPTQANSPPFFTSVASHVVVAMPVLLYMLFSRHVLGEAGFVPVDAVVCAPGAILRDCVLVGGGEGGNATVTPMSFTATCTSEFPFVTISGPESSWLAARLLFAMALSAFAVSQVRSWAQVLLHEGQVRQMQHLVDGAVVAVAASADAPPAAKLPTFTSKYTGQSIEDMPVAETTVDLIFMNCKLGATRAALEVSHAITQLLLLPVLIFILCALTLHRGHIRVGFAALIDAALLRIGIDPGAYLRRAAAAAADGTSLSGGESVSASVLASGYPLGSAIAAVFGDSLASHPLSRLSDPNVTLPILLFVFVMLLACWGVLTIALVAFYEQLYPSLIASKAKKPAAGASGAPAAGTAVAASGGGGKKDGKKDESKKRK